MEDANYLAQNIQSTDLSGIKKLNKGIGGFFGSIGSPLLFVLISGAYMLVVVMGALLGEYRRLGGIIEPEVSMETAVASVLGLLAFILAFTFSVTWTRFANRNLLVLAHAKAIGVCHLRAGLIPAKQKQESRRALFEYASLLQAVRAGPDLHRSLVRITELHSSLWQQTVSLVNEDMDSELRSLFVASVNDLISISLERKVIALFIRIPNAIWSSLLVLAFISLFAFGYLAGMGGVDKLFQLSLLPLAFGLVIVLIAELNSVHPQSHFKVAKQPLEEVLEIMKKDI